VILPAERLVGDDLSAFDDRIGHGRHQVLHSMLLREGFESIQRRPQLGCMSRGRQRRQ
jgi:hypothetical protein